MNGPLDVDAHSQPVRERDLSRLGVKLLVAWGCGLLWGAGPFLIWVFLLAGVGAALVGGRLNFLWWCIAGLSLIGTIVSPGLMGAYLAGGWGRGMKSGLFALLVSVKSQDIVNSFERSSYFVEVSGHREPCQAVLRRANSGLRRATVSEMS